MDSIEKLLHRIIDHNELSPELQRELKELCTKHEPDSNQTAKLRAVWFDALRNRETDSRTIALINLIEETIKIIGKSYTSVIKPEAYFSPGDNCHAKIINEIRKARNSIDICVFTISDNRISDEIVKAFEAGVQVRIITDNEKLFDKGSDIDYLWRKGLPVKVDYTKHHMHHKFAIFDQKRLITGSYNWTMSANDYNHENIVLLNSQSILEAFKSVFQDLWKELQTLQ